MAVRDFTERFSANTLKQLTPTNWDRLIKELNTRFNELEKIVPPLEAAEDLLLSIGLDRVNDVLAPAFESLEKLVDVGLLLSTTSKTNATVQTGVIEFVVEGDPGLFAPAHNIVVTTPDEPSVAMQGTKVSYNVETGSLFVNVTHINGAGTYADWKIDIGLPPAVVPGDAENIAYNPITGSDFNDVNSVADALDELDVRTANAQADVSQLQNEIGGFQTDINNLQNDVSSFEDDIGSVLSAVSVVQADISSLRDPQHIVVAASGALNNERVFTAGNGVRITDGGAGNNLTLISDGGQFVNLALAVSAAGNALTIALKGSDGNDPSSTNPVKIPFRNSTQTDGTPVWRSITAANSITIPSGGTLGVTSNQAFRLWVVAFDDSGTIRLGVVNTLITGNNASIRPLTEWAVESATALSTGSDSAQVIYSSANISNKSYKVLGFIEWGTSGLTAGSWTTTNLKRVQVFGPGVQLPGAILQHFTVQHSGSFSTGSNTFVGTNDTISIVPVSAANLLKIEATAQLGVDGTTQAVEARFSRGTTNNTNMMGSVVHIDYDGAEGKAHGHWMLYDKPNTESSQTYEMQIRGGPDDTAHWLPAGVPGIFTATEFMS